MASFVVYANEAKPVNSVYMFKGWLFIIVIKQLLPYRIKRGMHEVVYYKANWIWWIHFQQYLKLSP